MKSDVSMVHGEFSKINAILTTPNLKMMKILDGWLLWWKHQDYIFFFIFSNPHCRMWICPRIILKSSIYILLISSLRFSCDIILGCIHLLNTRKIVTILISIVVILTSIDPILEKCVHLQVQYSQVLSQYLSVLKQF